MLSHQSVDVLTSILFTGTEAYPVYSLTKFHRIILIQLCNSVLFIIFPLA
jgi:hypothetical protein